MSSKQAQLEHVVVRYFQQRADIAISYTAPGVYRIELLSSASRQHFGSGRSIDQTITLVFSGEMLSLHPTGELITTGHRFLDVIRNDLERDSQRNPRLTVAHVATQPILPTGQLAIPGLSFRLGRNSQQSIRYSWRYLPSFILTYRVVYQTDQQSENIVRLAYDGLTGQLRPELLLLQDDLFVADGEPDNVDMAGCFDLEQILQAAHIEMEQRIRPDIQLVGHELRQILEKDRQGAEKSFQEKLGDLRRDDIEGRRALTEWRDKYVLDLEQKYTYRVNVSLLSILRLWWPVISYDLVISGKQKTLFLSNIPYHSQLGRVNWYTCPTCGGRESFNACLIGHHVECSVCSPVPLECIACGDPMCREHGGACAHCGQSVCNDDHKACAYGQHEPDTYYCPTCLKRSFEGKLLCLDCLEPCAICHQDFAHEHLRTCRIGRERICIVSTAEPDGIECQQCHDTTCRAHGLATAEGTWVCRDHGAKTTCCHRVFALSRVVGCCVGQREVLCPDPEHRFYCADCKLSVCENHSSPLQSHPNLRVCNTHRRDCPLCQPTFSYLAADLASCVSCRRQVCSTHRNKCAVCHQPVCTEHVRISSNGENLCPSHTGVCSLCHPQSSIHRLDTLTTCAQDGQMVCPKHRVICEVCGRTHLCRTHAGRAPRCTSCGRLSCTTGGCSTTMNTCRTCGMRYCTHCFTIHRQCITCASVTNVAFTGDAKLRLDQAAKKSDGDTASLVTQMLEKSDYITYRSAMNRTYRVDLFRCEPPLLQRLLSFNFSLPKRQVRVVSEINTGQILAVRVEQAVS